MTKTMPTSTRKSEAARLGPGTPLPQLLSLDDTAKLLGCSLKTLRRRITAGELPVIRLGRLVRVHPQDLERFIAGRCSL